MVRYVCLDFETNGFPDDVCKPLPWSSYPIQVSRTAVEGGEVIHLYDSHIRGAETFNPWVAKNVPITLSELKEAPALTNVIRDIAELLRPTDWIVAHNCRFDLETRVARTAQKGRLQPTQKITFHSQSPALLHHELFLYALRVSWAE